MEVSIMDEVKKEECHMTSAVAFMEGGIQEPCDDACSICLEAFESSDPSTVTSCKHEFHLQCVLEWCQRSSNCPMCWQPISLKDPASQELLEGVEQERNIRVAPSRNTTIFHHPSLGDFELQHLPMGMNGSDLEDRIIQHLAAAAAMGRTHHRVARREGSRSRSSANARQQFVVFSANPNASSNGPASPENELPATTVTNLSAPLTPIHNEAILQQMSSSVENNQISASSSGSLFMPTNPLRISNDNRSYVSQPSLPNQDAGGPSEFQSLSDNWKTRFSAISTKYKESISKSTRGWKEKLFSRSSSVADISSEVRREVNAGMATVSRMMERLETRDNNRGGRGPLANNINPPVAERSNQDSRDISNETPSNGSDGNNSATFAANPISS